ncbi:kinase-like domain-containing protein [Phakopsora pachyrhizi]|uniref:Kinase-like domain-containing protein n=1 Tax=Phakopsora pachyrhizi TaxID=170000 RepID=A0AAV0AME3_PHAPC|nr:kinase-like domain-containing protein [Phakopsora pachyrhizi]CAH7670017.1 kinase-like domain-containing protein [Phakopsora pachyrhizi]
MTSQKFNGKPSNASNHNLVGHKIDDGRLELMSVLGLGAYGVVYLARDLTSPDMENPKFYAVKALNKIGLDARQKAFQRREIALHSLASSHASIVTLHAVIESPSCLFVILDYCPDGDLFGMITEKQKYLGKNEAIRCVFVQIIEAVQFCHRLGISHRDLKPENILCKKDGDEVVLADFGLATAERTSTDFGCGSTFYMSPECQGGLFQKLGCYSTIHNDIWSLGVILVNLTCGRNPWKQACPSDETFKAYLSNPEFLRSILPISLPLNQLLKRIFSLNPLGRISLEDMKAQVLKIKNFNMTAEELSKSTRATREAARAWFPDVPPSPKPLPNAEASSWKSNFAKKAKKQSRNKNDDGEHVSRNQLDANGDVWKQDVRYEETSSSSCATTVINDSTDSTFWTMNNQRPGPHQQRLWKQLKSPFHVLHSSRDSEQSYKNRFFGSQNATSKAQHHPTSQRKDEASSAQVPTGPLVTAFTSASISNSSSSSSSSNERVAKPRGFSARFVGPLKQSVSPNRDSGSPNSGTRKKILAKPMVFNRPNAPAPIILKPCTPESSGSSTSSRSRGLITPTNKKGKHSTLTFLPSTPPSSASPSSSTFGFIKKSAKKFPFSSHSELPPTPSTPSHPGKEPVSPTTHQRKVRSPAPISIRKCDDMKKISFINCCSDDEDENGSGADADFELDDDDDEERRLHKNKVTAHREAALRNVYPAIYVSESGQ